MTRLLSIIFIVVSMFIASGCTEWLDIKPESEVVLEDFWQNESQVNQVLAACYRSMTEADVIGKMLVWGELRSDNVTFGNDVPEDMSKMLNVDISPKNGYNHWGSFYSIINNCNTFLYYAPDVVKIDQDFTESKLKSLEAEVLTIRAMSYFYLIRSFKKVPWIDQPSIDDSQNYMIADTTEDYILGNIIVDLNTALISARDRFENTEYTRGRITKNAVRALLADIYLWQGDFNTSIQYCDQILNDNEQGLALLNGKNVLEQVFYEGNSAESIFELQFDDLTMINYTLRDFYGYYGDELGFWSFPAVLVSGGSASPFTYQVGAGYESKEDLREKDFLRPSGDKFYVFKYAGENRYENTAGYSDYSNYRNTTANWIIYRLSDIILMKAEALIQLESNNAEAMELINTTYLRSNPELMGEGLRLEDYNTKFELEKLVLRERQRELMFEGKRWFDLMRLARRAGDPTPLLSYVGKKYSGTGSAQLLKMQIMDALYLPIHADELEANTALRQNDFYTLTGEE